MFSHGLSENECGSGSYSTHTSHPKDKHRFENESSRPICSYRDRWSDHEFICASTDYRLSKWFLSFDTLFNMESAMRPQSHSDPSVSRTSSDRSPNVNRQSQNAHEPPHGPTIGAAICAYVPRGGYLQINQESVTEQNRWGDTTRSDVYSTSRTQGTEGIPGGTGRRVRSCTAILKAKPVKRRLVPLIVSTIFLILVLSLCKARSFLVQSRILTD